MRILTLNAGVPYRVSRHHWVQVVEGGKDAGVVGVKVGVDGLLDDADGVVGPPVQVGANLGEDVLRHIVERVRLQHICMHPSAQK